MENWKTVYDWQVTDEDNNQMGRKLSDGIYEFKESDWFDGEVSVIINLAEYSHEDKVECLATYGYKWNGESFVDTMGGMVTQWIIAECLFECRYFV